MEEHKNGIKADNRLENLCLLCPNCHSQTSTFRGRNNSTKKSTGSGFCIDCSEKVTIDVVRCQKCYGKYRTTIRTNYPELSILIVMVENKGYAAVGRELGVTGNTIKKYIKVRQTNNPL